MSNLELDIIFLLTVVVLVLIVINHSLFRIGLSGKTKLIRIRRNFSFFWGVGERKERKHADHSHIDQVLVHLSEKLENDKKKSTGGSD